MAMLGNGPWAAPAAEAVPAWIITGTVALAVLAALAVRVVRLVPSGECLVLFRCGRPVGVGGPGVVLVLPLLDRGVRVPLRPACIDLLWLKATTRDGVAVKVNGAVLASVCDPVRYCLARESPLSDTPLSAATAAAEAEVRRYVAGRELAELSGPTGVERTDLQSRITARIRQLGVEVTRIELDRIEIPLTTDLIRWAETFSARVRPAVRTRPVHPWEGPDPARVPEPRL